MSSNGWDEHKIYVTKTLERIDDRLGCIEHRLDRMSGKMNQLEVKAGVWGALGSLAVIMVMVYLRGM